MATATKDAILFAATELARQVAIDAAEWPEHVGDHLGVVVEGDRLVSHQFASTAPGYRGWHWTVTLARPDWPKELQLANELKPDAVLVSCYKAIPRSRDSASMMARMSEFPVSTVGVLQKDEAFRTMAPSVSVLRGIRELPDPTA